ncbi:MAG TPA: hypothetical protein VMF31_00725 [Solirubrobacterales bacterium]|nr:hypothetical protein [Solirubrobacterales bacterium]
MKVIDVNSCLDLNGTVTRFRVRSWSLSDSIFLVRSAASRPSASGWTAAFGRLELHLAGSVSIESALAELPPGGRCLSVRAGRNRSAAAAWLPRRIGPNDEPAPVNR